MVGPSVKLPLISWLFIILYKIGYVHIKQKFKDEIFKLF